MAGFTARMELHGAKRSDYDDLHEAMEDEGFTRYYVVDQGVRYHLPLAEYILEGPFTIEQTLAKAEQAAVRTGKICSILVTEAKQWTASGLDGA